MDTTDPDTTNSIANRLISEEWYNDLYNCLDNNGYVIQQLSADYTGTENVISYGQLQLVEYIKTPIILTYNGRILFAILKK